MTVAVFVCMLQAQSERVKLSTDYADYTERKNRNNPLEAALTLACCWVLPGVVLNMADLFF
jgi:hypothetical protein